MPLLLRFYVFVLAEVGVSLAVVRKRRETFVRGLTALGLLHVVVLTLWLGPAAFAAFCSAVLALSVWEAAEGGVAARAVLAGLSLATGAAAYLWLPAAAAALLAVVVAASAVFLPAAVVRRPAFTAVLALGLMAPGAAFLARLAAPHPGPALGLIVLVQFNDAFAYFGGKRFGRTHPFPTISPNKSVEGYAAGALATAVGIVVLHTLVPALPARDALPLGVLLWLCAVVSANVGDLAVSAYKRARGVKDSGRLLPGHGGVLDRFGNLLLAAPVFGLLLSLHLI